MQAIAVRPGTPNSIHMAELPRPRVTDIPEPEPQPAEEYGDEQAE